MSPASACCLRSCKRRPTRSISLCVCRPFSVCRGRRQQNFFSQGLGQLRTADAHALARFDLGAKAGDRPVVPVGYRLFQQRSDDAQGGFTLHRRRPGRDARLQRRDAAGGEVAAPEPNRILAHAKRLRNLRAGPARQRQKHGARPVRLPAITRASQSQKGGALLIARHNRRLPAMPHTMQITCGSESQKTYPLVNQTESA